VITWVIGQGGLLGSAVARRVGRLYAPGPIPWQEPQRARETLHDQARGLEREAGGGPWRVIWAAGSATTSSPRHEALAELVPLQALLSGLRSALPPGDGCFVLTSSAGGVYAGAAHPPFSTTTTPAPLSPYGELKLAQEALATETLAGIVPVVVGRISNLYGPGQNLDKLQGLISHLARAAVTRQPVNIFVPLDTTRDYLTADDAAAAILQATERRTSPGVSLEIIATGRGTTIGQLIRTMNEIAKRKVPVALGTHPSALAQAPDLRLVPSISLPQVTPLPVGMKAVYDDILHRAQRSQSVAAGG
jgi:UDP-glucose 4-epimerase